MSGEHITVDDTNEIRKGLDIKGFQTRSEKSGRVDINLLMNKVRNEEKKQKKESIVFFGLLGSVVVVTGIIASL
ncbi:MAG: hypothetical protein CMI80_01085 [Candidatus Pelagibacter sp.]|nr:hypothetical protein [Candidatus Pelagibacter sp.]|tara:strand:+ start:508 stop:729 length:222 start_codon:yes stop_codon:yes gene_type:complete